MRVPDITRYLILTAGLLILAAGCNRPPARVTAEAVDPDAAKKAIEMFDANKDGALDLTELQKAPGLRAGIAQIKKINPAAVGPKIYEEQIRGVKLTEKDIQARIDAWKQSKQGRMPYVCTILHNGNPLVGATVVAEPEPFLGSEIKGGTGETNQSGSVTLASAAPASGGPGGLSPGYYRLKITKTGENIPAQYNTATTLGFEVSSDNQSGRGVGNMYDLKY